MDKVRKWYLAHSKWSILVLVIVASLYAPLELTRLIVTYPKGMDAELWFELIVVIWLLYIGSMVTVGFLISQVKTLKGLR